MASTSLKAQGNYFENISVFPSVINGRINLVKFLEASTDLVTLVERLGAVYAPVKFDMEGNIDKIKKFFIPNEDSCLLESMLQETTAGKTTATEGVLWLNRALLFFELAFAEILNNLNSGSCDVNMKQIFTVAYEGSVKKYHNWVTQQIFTFICKMSPSLPQVLKSFEVDDNVKAFQKKLTSLNITLHLVRCKIDDFFREHDLLNEKTTKHNQNIKKTNT